MSAAGPSQGARPPPGERREAAQGGAYPSAAGPSQGARPPPGERREAAQGGRHPTDTPAAALHVESVGFGPPLVLLHGWALHAGLFSPLLPALARQHRVHAVDLPGHGHSATVHPWTLRTVVDALERRFGDEREPLSVLGWSLGGSVALEWAHAFPDRIARLVLVAGTPKFVAAPGWPHAMAAQTLERFGDELRVAYRPTLLRFLSLQVRDSDEGRATLAALRSQLSARGEPDPVALREALATLHAADLRREVANVRQPTLVVNGDRDTLVPLAAGAWLAQALPAGRLLPVPGAAHAPFLSHRATFSDAALAFLDDG